MTRKKAKSDEVAHAQEHVTAAAHTEKKAHSDEKKSYFKAHFANKDLVWIVVGIILFLVLGYAVIHYNVVTQQDYVSNVSKYNATPAPVGISGQQTSGSLSPVVVALTLHKQLCL